MKITSLAALEQQPSKPVYLVVAADAQDRDEALDKLAPGRRVLFEASVTGEQLALELETQSLLGSGTVVVREADKLAALDWLISYCERPVMERRLVLVASSMRPGKIQQAVAKAGIILALSGGDPIRWLVGQGVDQKAARRLVAIVGSDRALLARELEKLSTYGQVDEEAVAKLAVGHPTEAIWELGKAVTAKNPKRAVRVWRDLRAQGIAPLGILAAMRGQMRRIPNERMVVALADLESKLKNGYLEDPLFETKLVEWAS